MSLNYLCNATKETGDNKRVDEWKKARNKEQHTHTHAYTQQLAYF